MMKFTIKHNYFRSDLLRITVNCMGSGRLREFSLSNRDEVRAGYKTQKPAPNLPLPIQNVMGWFSIFQTVTSFGFGPYSFSSGLLSVTIKTNSQIPPISGISEINIIHPLFPIS